MLPCSVRRVAATAPQSPIILSALPRATSTSIIRSYRSTQCRRYSSSKPSRDNGSEDAPVRRSVQPSSDPTTSESTTSESKASESKASESKASGEKRKRKAKDVSDKFKFPSVPTTAHLPSNFVALSSFFSLHRPISVTSGLPRNVTDDAFASIFAAPTRGQKTTETISTISRTVEELEKPIPVISVRQQRQQPQQPQQEGDDAVQAFDHAAMQMLNPDGSEASVTLQLQNMSGRFMPFRPPPLPLSLQESSSRTSNSSSSSSSSSTVKDATETSEDAAAQQDAQTRVYKAVFTIEETTDANGEIKFMAHSPELIEQDSLSSSDECAEDESGLSSSTSDTEATAADMLTPRTFLERMALRQLRYEEGRSRRGTLWAISVKRQRKLKMKKKKYKKLTKKLRHERLKHGRS